MKYPNIISGKFLNRLNRFVAEVEVEGSVERVHVKNTGRCKELFIPGVTVYLTKSGNPNRKTAYDLVAVIKNESHLINIDSQAPNHAVKEWLQDKKFDFIKPEFTYGDSKLDFYMEKGRDKYLMEVKGCTLEIDGIGYFPDAPTTRGIKHIKELIRGVKEGYKCYLAFVIQMEGVSEVRPNITTHPEFGKVLAEAKAEGVKVLMLTCKVEPDFLEIEI